MQKRKGPRTFAHNRKSKKLANFMKQNSHKTAKKTKIFFINVILNKYGIFFTAGSIPSSCSNYSSSPY